MKKLKIKQGSVVFCENTLGNEMYVISNGSVKIYKTINAERVDLAILKKNSFFGEMSLLLGEARTATAEALEDTELLALDKESLLNKLKTDSVFAERMLLVLARRLKEADDIISRLEGEKKSLEVIYGNR
jgi:CRP/FNR family cyclic AMP-dependent transcriptional regulator